MCAGVGNKKSMLFKLVKYSYTARLHQHLWWEQSIGQTVADSVAVIICRGSNLIQCAEGWTNLAPHSLYKLNQQYVSYPLQRSETSIANNSQFVFCNDTCEMNTFYGAMFTLHSCTVLYIAIHGYIHILLWTGVAKWIASPAQMLMLSHWTRNFTCIA